MTKVIITAALTGPVATTADHAGLPVTPEQIAQAAFDAYNAGAAVAHVHVRGTDGLPTADPEIARDVMGRIAERCPILVQLSTGVGLTVPFADREQLAELRPRMATLNPCTMSFGSGEFRNPPADVRRLAARMLELGVKPELEVYDSGHIDVCLDLLKEGLLKEPLQFSIVMGVKGGMAASAENLLQTSRKLPSGSLWQAIAIGRLNLDLTAMAILLGGNARTGMEDTLYISKGVPAPDNASLVARLAGVCRSLGREVASCTEAAAIIGLQRTTTGSVEQGKSAS